jgi:hypothetical protein
MYNISQNIFLTFFMIIFCNIWFLFESRLMWEVKYYKSAEKCFRGYNSKTLHLKHNMIRSLSYLKNEFSFNVNIYVFTCVLRNRTHSKLNKGYKLISVCCCTACASSLHLSLVAAINRQLVIWEENINWTV